MNEIDTAHPIGDPATAVAQTDDPIVLAGFRAAGAGVRICTRCGVMVVPAHNNRSNFRHSSDNRARVLIRPAIGA